MSFAIITVVLGVLLLSMALTGSVLRRLPLSASVLYLAVGIVVGQHVLGLVHVDFLRHARVLERITEIAVLLSLFTAGLKLRPNVTDNRWHLPIRLASVSMVATVALVAAFGTLVLGMPLGAAVLFGGVIAPTDPVLASDVQVSHAGDRDRLRFGLTGEAGLNDGTAFPFVMLGLGLLGLHPVGAHYLRWFLVDVVWAVGAGLAVGALLGTALGRLVVYLRSRHEEAYGLDEFLTLGLIALAYGVAVLLHAYGFLAVFAAGHAVRRIESRAAGDGPVPDVTAVGGAETHRDLATDEKQAPAYLAHMVLGFNEQLERIAEVILVIAVGAMLRPEYLRLEVLVFVPILLFGVRPLAVTLGLLRGRSDNRQKAFIAWFGIRGIGSLYYLAYAIEHGLPRPIAERLAGLTLLTVATSIVVHGISVTPLMNAYGRRSERASHPRLRPRESA